MQQPKRADLVLWYCAYFSEQFYQTLATTVAVGLHLVIAAVILLGPVCRDMGLER